MKYLFCPLGLIQRSSDFENVGSNDENSKKDNEEKPKYKNVYAK